VPLVIGVALGDALWSVAAALGLAWVVGTYGWIMDVLKWVAVAVFALMGWCLSETRTRPSQPTAR
jgi:threonine/homoserine/homoserine lactone efflux protein